MLKPDQLNYADYDALNYLLVQGLKLTQAARRAGISPFRLRNLLKRDDVKPIVNQIHNEVFLELKALGMEVIAKLREGLQSENPYIVQQCIDKWFRTQGVYKEVLEHVVTAEDVVAELLKNRKETKVKMETVEDKGDLMDLEAFEDGETIH